MSRSNIELTDLKTQMHRTSNSSSTRILNRHSLSSCPKSHHRTRKMSADSPFRVPSQSIPSVSSIDAYDAPEVLSITVDGPNDEGSDALSSYSFVPITSSPGQRNRRRFLSAGSMGNTRDSSVNPSAVPSGQSTPTGKSDAASKRRVRETASDIENAYFRQFWSRYLKGFDRVLVSDLLNKFLKDLATSSSSYDSGEAFTSEELIRFFRPAPRGKGDKLRETLDPDGNSAIGPLKLESVLRRLGKLATSREILIALAEGGGPRIWPALKSGTDAKTSLRFNLQNQLKVLFEIKGIHLVNSGASGSGVTTELLRYFPIFDAELQSKYSESIQSGSANISKPPAIIYINLKNCICWQEAIWETKVQLGFEGCNIYDGLHHNIHYFVNTLSTKENTILIFDNTSPIVASWICGALSPFAGKATIIMLGDNLSKVKYNSLLTTTKFVQLENITADDQMIVAEYLLELDASKVEGLASISMDTPQRPPKAAFDSKIMQVITTECSKGNLNVLRFLISCPPDDIRKWIDNSVNKEYKLEDLSVFDEVMIQYIVDIQPLLKISQMGLCHWFYSDTFDCCSSIDKFSQDECLSILRKHGLLEINKNLFQINLPSYLISLVSQNDTFSHSSPSKSKSSEEYSAFESRMKSFWNNIIKHTTNIVSALADGVSSGTNANDLSSIDPVFIFSELDPVSAVFTDRNRGPMASLTFLLPQIRLLLISLLLDETTRTENYVESLLTGMIRIPGNPYVLMICDGVDYSWSFLVPDSSTIHAIAVVLGDLVFPQDLRSSLLLNDSFVTTILKLLQIIADDEEMLSYLSKLRKVQAHMYEEKQLESYDLYPDQHLSQHSDRSGARASELVILSSVACLIRLHKYNAAEKVLSYSLTFLSEEQKQKSEEEMNEINENDEEVDINNEPALEQSVHSTTSSNNTPQGSSRAAIVNIAEEMNAEDYMLQVDRENINYTETYVFHRGSMAELQGLWMKACCNHLRCLREHDSVRQLALFHPDDKTILEKLDQEDRDALPKHSTMQILNELNKSIDIALNNELERNDIDEMAIASSIQSESLLYVLKLKTMLLIADHQAAVVLSTYTKRNFSLWHILQSIIESKGANGSLLTTIFRDIRSVDHSSVRRVEELLKRYDLILKYLGETSGSNPNPTNPNPSTDEAERPLLLDVLDDLIVIKFKCLVLVRCGDLYFSLRRYSDAQKIYERVAVLCKDPRYRKYLQHTIFYAQAVSGNAACLVNTKGNALLGPSPQLLLAIEMYKEAYFCCSRAAPFSAARHFQIHILQLWTEILSSVNKFDVAKRLLLDEINKMEYEIQVLKNQKLDILYHQMISHYHAFYWQLIHQYGRIIREQQQELLGGIPGNTAAEKSLQSLYDEKISFVKMHLDENDVCEAMMCVDWIEELCTRSSAENDIYFLDDDEEGAQPLIDEDTYMSRAGKLVRGLDVLRLNYSETGCDSLLHGITLILRRQSKLILMTNRLATEKMDIAKSSLESVMDVFRDMSGIGYVVDLADVQAELGLVLAANNEQGEATSLFTQALDLYRPLFGENDIRVGEYCYRKAVALQDLKLFEESEEFVKEAINIFNQLPPGAKKGRALTACYSIKGFLLQELQEYEEAKEAYKIALQICGRMFGKEGIEMSSHVAKIFNNLASVANALGETSEAQSLYEATVVMLKKQGKEMSIQMLIVLENLEQLLRQEGKIENADFFRSRVDELTEKLCDEMDRREELLKQRQKQREEMNKRNETENAEKKKEKKDEEDGEEEGEEEEEEEEEEKPSSGYRCILM